MLSANLRKSRQEKGQLKLNEWHLRRQEGIPASRTAFLPTSDSRKHFRQKGETLTL